MAMDMAVGKIRGWRRDLPDKTSLVMELVAGVNSSGDTHQVKAVQALWVWRQACVYGDGGGTLHVIFNDNLFYSTFLK